MQSKNGTAIHRVTAATVTSRSPHCPLPVHLSADLRRRPSYDRSLPLPAQAAHRLQPQGQHWRLPGQSSRSLGSGGGDRESPQTGDALQRLGFSGGHAQCPVWHQQDGKQVACRLSWRFEAGSHWAKIRRVRG